MTDDRVIASSKNITSNVVWRICERFGAQGINFIVSVVLARILMPSEFALISLVLVFINILGVFILSGLGTALVQKKDIDELDYATTFWSNLALSIILYLIVFICAPYLSKLFEQPDMTVVLRVLALTLIVGGYNSVPVSIISRNMQFRLLFRVTLTGTMLSAVVGIFMAIRGAGVWALVAQNLTIHAVNIVLLWRTIDWKPCFKFSFERLKPIFKFGWNVYLAQLIDTIYQNMRTLLIGRYYPGDVVAFYNRGTHIPLFINSNINSAIQSVVFPAYTKYRDDRVRMLAMMRRAVSLSTYLIFPCMMGLAMVAEPLIILMYTEKWLPCVPYMQIGCFVYALNAMHVVYLQSIIAIGRSDISLKVEVIKKTITVAVLIYCINVSVFATAFSAVPLGVFALIVNAFPVSRQFNYSYWEQFKDVFPSLFLTLIMGAATYLVGLIPTGDWIKLLLQVTTGILVYITLSVVTHNKDYIYILNYVKSMVTSKFKIKKGRCR